MASIAGKEGNPMAAAYSVAKAAVIGMTKSIGKDVARTGVIVNCIAPAVIETPILEGLSDDHVDYMVERIPMGRMGRRTRSRRSRAGLPARSARSRPARHTTSPVAGRSTDAPDHSLGRRRWQGLGRRRGRQRRPLPQAVRDHEPMRLLRGETFRRRASPVTPVDPYSLELGSAHAHLAARPARGLCAGVTYERSRDARMEESSGSDVYAARLRRSTGPALPQGRQLRRTVGPGEPIGIRGDSTGTCRSRRSGSCSARRADPRLHDRERRLLPRDRGGEPALPHAGEGLSRARARSARPLHPAAGAAPLPDRSCAYPTRRARSSTRTRRRRRRWCARSRSSPRGSSARILFRRDPCSSPERGSSRRSRSASSPATGSRSTCRRSAPSSNPVASPTNLV